MKLTGATALCACAGGVVGISGCSGSTGVSNVPPAPVGSYRRDGDRVVVSLAGADQLNAVGGAVKFTLDGGEDAGVKIVVVHLEPGTYRAFADRCTHRGKELDYLPEGRKLQCRSGKAQFDLEGNAIRGPAESRLMVYPTRQDGEELVIEVS
jgi:nitrite reductase/ring-hydroxylating ferredoxin subunit